MKFLFLLMGFSISGIATEMFSDDSAIDLNVIAVITDQAELQIDSAVEKICIHAPDIPGIRKSFIEMLKNQHSEIKFPAYGKMVSIEYLCELETIKGIKKKYYLQKFDNSFLVWSVTVYNTAKGWIYKDVSVDNWMDFDFIFHHEMHSKVIWPIPSNP